MYDFLSRYSNSFLKDQIKQNRSSLIAIDKEKKELSEQIRYLSIFNENREFYDEYNSSKRPDDFFIKNESHILLCQGAISVLGNYGINPNDASVDDIRKRLDYIEEQRKHIKDEVDVLNSRLDSLTLQQKNLIAFLQQDKSKNKDIQKGQER